MTSIKHVLTILAVADLEQSRAFYQAAFGWIAEVEVPVYVEFAVDGGQRVGLYEREAFARNVGQVPFRLPPGSLAPTELYFYVDDITAAIERMEQAGAQALSPLMLRDWGDQAAYFADPSGNVLVLAQPQHEDAR